MNPTTRTGLLLRLGSGGGLAGMAAAGVPELPCCANEEAKGDRKSDAGANALDGLLLLPSPPLPLQLLPLPALLPLVQAAAAPGAASASAATDLLSGAAAVPVMEAAPAGCGGTPLGVGGPLLVAARCAWEGPARGEGPGTPSV